MNNLLKSQLPNLNKCLIFLWELDQKLVKNLDQESYSGLNQVKCGGKLISRKKVRIQERINTININVAKLKGIYQKKMKIAKIVNSLEWLHSHTKEEVCSSVYFYS